IALTSPPTAQYWAYYASPYPCATPHHEAGTAISPPKPPGTAPVPSPSGSVPATQSKLPQPSPPNRTAHRHRRHPPMGSPEPAWTRFSSDSPRPPPVSATRPPAFRGDARWQMPGSSCSRPLPARKPYRHAAPGETSCSSPHGPQRPPPLPLRRTPLPQAQARSPPHPADPPPSVASRSPPCRRRELPPTPDATPEVSGTATTPPDATSRSLSPAASLPASQ